MTVARRPVDEAVRDILDDFTRGPFRRPTPAGGGEAPQAAPPPHFRPSPVVALDVPVKVAVAIVGVSIPLFVSAVIEGGTSGFVLGVGSIALLANLVPAAIAAAFPALQVLFTTYHVDEEGIRTETRLFSKQQHAVPWSKVTALVERQTLFDRVFGLRRLRVIAYGERGASLSLVGLRSWKPLRDRIAHEMADSASVESLFGND